MNEINWKTLFIIQTVFMLLIANGIMFKMNIFSSNSDVNIISDVYAGTTEDAIKQDEASLIDVSISDSVKIDIENDKKDIEEKIKLLKEDSIESDVKIDIKKEENIFSKSDKIIVTEVENQFKDKIKKTFYTTVTSYNSEVGQTDDSPCIAASGMNVCDRNFEDIVATNDLPFHTKILIPEYFGDRIFYVEDRMNTRYTGTGRLDIWMKNKKDSKAWGIREVKIIVLK